MKAFRLNEFGGTEHMTFEEIETPKPGAGEVLIKTSVAGINFADIMLRQNKYMFTPELPFTLGFEVAGTVEEIGSGVANLKVGQRILAMMRGGGYAEFATANALQTFPIPDEMSFGESTVLMVQGLTALGLLEDLRDGDAILIHAAAGGVGSLLVQIAKSRGVKVIGTASSPEKLEKVISLGADVGINYTEDNWVDQVLEATDGRGANLIIEMIGGEQGRRNLGCLALKGTMIIYGAVTGQDFQVSALGLLGKMQTVKGYNLNLETPQNMMSFTGELMNLHKSGKLEFMIQEFPLENAVEAHHAIESRKTMGKVVLTAV